MGVCGVQLNKNGELNVSDFADEFCVRELGLNSDSVLSHSLAVRYGDIL